MPVEQNDPLATWGEHDPLADWGDTSKLDPLSDWKVDPTEEEAKRTSPIGRVFRGIGDALSLGQYATMGMLDVWTDAGIPKSLGEAMSTWKKGVATEVKEGSFFFTEKRKSFKDILMKFVPELDDVSAWSYIKGYARTGNAQGAAVDSAMDAAAMKAAGGAPSFSMADVAGLAGDIALDPTTYLSFGGTKALRQFSKAGKEMAISKEGAEALAKESKYLMGNIEPLREFLDTKNVTIGLAKRYQSEVAEITARKAEKEAAARAESDLLLGLYPEKRGATMSKYLNDVVNARGEAETALAKTNATYQPLFGKQSTQAAAFNALERKTLQDAKAAWQDVGEVVTDEALDTPLRKFAQIFHSAADLPVDEFAAKQALLDIPEIAAKVVDKGGMRIAGKQAVTAAQFKKFAEFTRLNVVGEKIKAIKESVPVRSLGAAAGHLFVAKHGLPEPLKKSLTLLENGFDSWGRETLYDTSKVFSDIPLAEREKLGALLWDVSEATDELVRGTAKVKDGRHVVTGEHVTQAFALEQKMLADAKLAPETHAAYAAMRQRMSELAGLDTEADLLQHQRLNYSPQMWEAIKDGKVGANVQRGMRKMLPNKLGAAEQRVFANRAEAAAAGYKPVLDAAALYGLRVMQSKRAHTIASFNDSVTTFFPKMIFNKDRTRIVSLGVEAGKATAEDYAFAKTLTKKIQRIGDGVFVEGASQDADNGLKMLGRIWDRHMGVFRASATVFSPGFAVKQGASNTIAAVLKMGADAMGMMDPQVFREAYTQVVKNRPGVFRGTSTLGEAFTGDSLWKEMLDYAVIREQPIDYDLVRAVRKAPQVEKAFLKQLDAHLAKNASSEKPAVVRGMQALGRGMARYTGLAGNVENISRASLYINARRLGHAPEGAAKLVDETLFNYAHGLSDFEHDVVRRFIMPFYSFRRFAIPMVAKVVATSPGRASMFAKTAPLVETAAAHLVSSFEKYETGEKLTPEEQYALKGAGYVLEQPGAMVGFNQSMQAVFKTFNGMTPMDAITDLYHASEDGAQRFAEKTFLAQLAPVLKISLQQVAGKDFFSGRTKEQMSWNKTLNTDDPNHVMAALTAAAMATGGNAYLAALAGAGAEAAGKMSPQIAQRVLGNLIGLEKGTDAEGKEVLYFSPWRFAQVSSFMPGMNSVLRMFKDDGRTPTQKAVHFLFGVSTMNVDLQKAAEFRKKDLDKQEGKIKSAMDHAEEEGREKSYYDAKEELDEFWKAHQEEYDALSSPNIRGGQ